MCTGYRFIFAKSRDTAPEKQAQGLRLAFLAANRAPVCVNADICVCLFVRHQPELLALLPSMEIQKEKRCHNAQPPALHHLCFNTKICTHT